MATNRQIPHPVPVRKSPEDEFQVDSAGTHHPDQPYIRGVLKTGNTAQVGASVAAPVADNTQHLLV
jgi:hypothetical protein